jgi:hypothetical protein
MQISVIIIQIFGGLSLIPWFSMAGLSFMAFDSPKFTKKLTPWLFVISIFSYPFLLGGSYWWAWSNFLSGHIKSATFWSFLPILIFGVAYLIITRSSNFLNKLNKE